LDSYEPHYIRQTIFYRHTEVEGCSEGGNASAVSIK